MEGFAIIVAFGRSEGLYLYDPRTCASYWVSLKVLRVLSRMPAGFPLPLPSRKTHTLGHALEF